MSKVKGAQHTTWSHHETMVINLQDWVRREIANLQLSLTKEAPSISDDPSVQKILRSAEDMNVQLFDLMRSIINSGEREAKKSKKAQSPATGEASDSFDELDV